MVEHTLYTLNSTTRVVRCGIFNSVGENTLEFQLSAFALTHGNRDAVPDSQALSSFSPEAEIHASSAYWHHIEYPHVNISCPHWPHARNKMKFHPAMPEMLMNEEH